jgi:hypothetical protein
MYPSLPARSSLASTQQMAQSGRAMLTAKKAAVRQSEVAVMLATIVLPAASSFFMELACRTSHLAGKSI